jgi:protein-tyrosine phosphatase
MSPSAMPDDGAAIIELVARLLRGGHTVLVHCEAGKGRSVWMATRLLARDMGLPRRQAWQMVQGLVPNHSVHGPLLDDLNSEVRG